MKAALLRSARFLGRVVFWPLRSVYRFVMLMWTSGVLLVGSAQAAVADTGGWFVVPDLVQGNPQTVFERVPLASWSLPIQLSSDTDSFPYLSASMWRGVHAVSEAIMYLARALAAGAIALMQWTFSLGGLYRDNAPSIDSSVSSIGGAVFWPLLVITSVIAITAIYAKSKQVSIFGAVLEMIILAVIGVAFVTQASSIAAPLDDARTGLSDLAVQGYSNAASGGDNAAGYPDVAVQPGPQGAIRQLSDSMWNVYVVAPWCQVAFGSLDTCKKWGSHYVERDKQWVGLQLSQSVVGDFDNKCNPDLAKTKDQCALIRGESGSRFGGVLFSTFITIPLALFLITLSLFGLLAIVAFIVCLLLGPFFLAIMLIPGKPRAIGWKWVEATVGALLQSVLITLILGTVMVMSGIFSAITATVGIGTVAVLNMLVFWIAIKMRSNFENMTGMSTPGAQGVNPYVGMRLASAGVRGARSAVSNTAKAGLRSASGVVNQVMDPNSMSSKAASGVGRAARFGAFKMAAVGQAIRVPAPAPKPMAHATPYRAPGTGATPRVSLDKRATGGPQYGTPRRAGEAWKNDTPYSRNAVEGSTVRPLPSGTPSTGRRALPPAASSTAAQTSGPKVPAGAAPQSEVRGHRSARPETRKQQDPPRTFAAPSGEPGVVDSARRRTALPATRVSLTPEVRKRSAVVSYGQGLPLHAVTRRSPPLSKTRIPGKDSR